MIEKKTAAMLAAVIAVALAPPPAQATIIYTYPQPNAGYVSATNIVPIMTALYGSAGSWSDGTVTVTSSSSLERRTAPGGGWATWDEAPESERTTVGTLPVLFAEGLAMIDLTFNLPLFLFGVELEPDAFVPKIMTLEFFSGASSLGFITRSVDGDAGSRLFAGVTDVAFDRARISIAEGEGFALAQMRYSKTQPEFDPVPEPSPFLMFLGGLAALFLARFFWTHREKQ